MARVQNTLIGRSSGSVGGATFTTWKGINVLKSKAVSVANPNTIPQQSQRNRLTLLVAIYRLIALWVQIGFDKLAINKSAYNAFVSENIQSAISVSPTAVATLIPANLKVSKGIIGVAPVDSVNPVGGNDTVSVQGNTSLAPVGSSPDDVFTGVAWNETQNVWSDESTDSDRATGELSIIFPANLATNDVIHFWTFYQNASTKEVSDSTYVTQNAS